MPPQYVLKLYVAGRTAATQRAMGLVREICDRELGTAWSLDVIDLLVEPGAAERDRIIATPTLVKISPLPLRRVIGDMADRRLVLTCLGLCSSLPVSPEMR